MSKDFTFVRMYGNGMEMGIQYSMYLCSSTVCVYVGIACAIVCVTLLNRLDGDQVHRIVKRRIYKIHCV